MRIKNFNKGFTLIELLIVIAIIGVLSTLLMANFIGVRQRARDAQRKSDLRQIQAALEIYRSDNGSYPAIGGGNGQLSSNGSCKASLTDTNVTATYMKSIPCDPTGPNVSYTYLGGGTSYTLYACLENSSDSQKTAAPPNPSPTCATYFVVYSP
jgi:general secretion pathway protein G